MEDRRDVGENSCNYGDGTAQTGPILDVYDNDVDDLIYIYIYTHNFYNSNIITKSLLVYRGGR